MEGMLRNEGKIYFATLAFRGFVAMCPHFHFRIPVGIIRMTTKSGEINVEGTCIGLQN
jgi:hypothetical protein